MIKKIASLLILILLCTSFIFASDWHFVFGDVTQHPEILLGFLPSYLNAGVGYKGLSLLENNTTDFQILLGGGYNQRKLWQDPIGGETIRTNPLIYDVIDFDWTVKFSQGFFSNPMAKGDLITVAVAYNGQYEIARDSMVKGKQRANGGKHEVLSIDSFFSEHGAARKDNNIYPELNGDGQFLGSQLAAYLTINAMEDTIHENNGFLAKASLFWGPKAINSALDGYADYIAFRLDGIGAYTLYDYQSGGKSWFSIVLADRVNFSYTGGDAIPAFIQGPNSLGRKVRGFNTYTYNNAYSIVNNLDLRLAGPNLGVKGLAPRINLFLDFGYGWGAMNNTSPTIEETNFLASTGVQGTVTFFDFIDLGYQIAYLIKGDNFSKGSDRLVGSFTFFLDF